MFRESGAYLDRGYAPTTVGRNCTFALNFLFLNLIKNFVSTNLWLISKVLRRITKRQIAVINEDPKAEWAGMDPQDESELPNLDCEVTVGGIYLRLLVANPGWVLRKPKEILGELLEAALQGLQKEGVSKNP